MGFGSHWGTISRKEYPRRVRQQGRVESSHAAYPGHVTEDAELADHHALTLDLSAIILEEMPRVERYRIHALEADSRKEKDIKLRKDARLQKLEERLREPKNAQKRYADLTSSIRSHVTNALVVTHKPQRTDATAAFNKRYASHELFAEYQVAREQKEGNVWVRLQDDVLRSEWETSLHQEGKKT